jgi:hypothetical protein
MHRSIRSLVACLSVVVCLWPVSVGAQSQDTPSSSPSFTIDQARSAFSGPDYQLDRAYIWEWTVPPVASFQVRDLTNERVLMVMVYPDTNAAQLARLQAERTNEHLVVGYGPSTWQGNVALVQTTASQLQAVFQAQADRDNGVYVERGIAQDPATPNKAVDADFIEALNGGAANL